jgi:hypothetical protein
MFAWHQKNSGHYVCLPSPLLIRDVLARSSDQYNSQQPIRRLVFEVISQSETKSPQTRKHRKKEIEIMPLSYGGARTPSL